ncbi:MAG: T9SS type A sorting domain-containing protein [Bacteroidota bacterium]
MPLRHALLSLSAAALLSVGALPASAAEAETPRATLVLEQVDDATGPFRLSAPRPNPFSASTRLELTVDEASTLTVAVHDALGRRVALLHEGALRAGTYTLTVEAADLPPGLYLVRATDGRGQTATRSLSLVR